jgi:hypothetical protein
MSCNPEIVLHSPTRKPKVSVILIDWGVRESFHSLHYLNRQTCPRDDYELIWLEFYDRKPERLVQMVENGTCILDKWYVLGYPDDFIFHKHRLYNVGLMAASGDICVICDSDAVFGPTFIDNLLDAFAETPRAVIHVDEVRNNDRRFYPFNYPQIDELLGEGCINWDGETTTGLATDVDRIHGANYGACMAACRRDILAVGGADEHLDYLGYICGPYDLTFRLANYYRCPERWLQNEYLYHAWHPNTSGINADYQGPHDGRCMSLIALHARNTGRIDPYLKSPLLTGGDPWPIEHVLDFLRSSDESAWRSGSQPAASDMAYFAERDHQGCNVFCHCGRWYALPRRVTTFDPAMAQGGGYRSCLVAASLEDLHGKIGARQAAKLLNRVRRKVFAEPLHRLPIRAWRKSRRVVADMLAGRTHKA